MYAALLARRQAAAKLGGPNWEAKLDGGLDVMEVGGAEGGEGGVDRNSVFQSARFQALVSWSLPRYSFSPNTHFCQGTKRGFGEEEATSSPIKSFRGDDGGSRERDR